MGAGELGHGGSVAEGGRERVAGPEHARSNRRRGFGGCGLESWWLRRWAASSDRWVGREQGTAQANRGGSKGVGAGSRVRRLQLSGTSSASWGAR